MHSTFRSYLAGIVAIATVALSPVARGQSVEPNNAVYEVFVRSFATDAAGHCGDLAGAKAKLDYLNNNTGDSLGVGIVWLMPIFPAGSDHGYDVIDYRAINPDYGSLDDFKAFLAAAHQRHMRVILDIPFNHTSVDHPWFKAAVENEQDPHRSWYLIYPQDSAVAPPWFSITNSHGDKLKYFGLFDRTMPDLNFDNPDVRAEIKAIAKYWLDLGVDGFRLDAAKHMYGWTTSPTDSDTDKNNDWWKEFGDSVRGVKPDAIMVGEVLGGEDIRVKYAKGLDLLIDESFMNHTRDEVIQPYGGFLTNWKKFIADARQVNSRGQYDSFAYVASHDRDPRLESDLENRGGADTDAKYRLAMCILMSAGKYPVIYEGDELKQRGWHWKGQAPNDGGDGSGVYDETLREPLRWHAVNAGADQAAWQPPGQSGFLPKFEQDHDGLSVEEESADASSVLKLTEALGRLRSERPALANGEVGEILTDSPDWLVFEKTKAAQTCLVLINPTNHSNNYLFSDAFHPAYAHAKLLFWSDGALRKWEDSTSHASTIGGSVLVGPYGMVVLEP